MSREDWLERVGEHIREIRVGTGMSQEEFAHTANLSRSYCSGIERGKRNISIINLIRIAKVLEVEVGDLIPKVRVFKD